LVLILVDVFLLAAGVVGLARYERLTAQLSEMPGFQYPVHPNLVGAGGLLALFLGVLALIGTMTVLNNRPTPEHGRLTTPEP
jgi:hypothetical protein